jgi:hypothetical protein
MILCSEIIWTGKTTSTYCMRERGHEGKHSIDPEFVEPEKTEKKEVEDGDKNSQRI